MPVGIHLASLDEVEARFGLLVRNSAGPNAVATVAGRTGKKDRLERLVINGSFVAECLEPNDVDCVLLTGPDFPRDQIAERELFDGLPFLEIAVATQDAFDFFVNTMFATNRQQVPKGVVEVIL